MEIASVQTPQLVSVMARTCRRLHIEGIRLLLSHRVVLAKQSQLISFCTFMLADKSDRRFAIWRDCFVLGLRKISTDTSSLFCDVLSRCGSSHVTGLLLWHATELLESDPRLSSAFTSFTRLDYIFLALKRGDHGGTRLLRSLHSPLKSARIALSTFAYSQRSISQSRVIYARGSDPFWLLSKFSATLEVVKATGDVTIGGCQQRFLHVTELVIEQELPLIRPLVTSLPNLRILKFSAVTQVHGQDNLLALTSSIGKDFTTRECREINLRDQRTHGAWITLDTLVAPTVTAYAAALLSRIRRLHLYGCKGRPAIELPMLLSVIKEAQPTQLRLVFHMQEVEHITSIARLPEAALLSTFELCLLSRDKTLEFGTCFVSCAGS